MFVFSFNYTESLGCVSSKLYDSDYINALTTLYDQSVISTPRISKIELTPEGVYTELETIDDPAEFLSYPASLELKSWSLN